MKYDLKRILRPLALVFGATCSFVWTADFNSVNGQQVETESNRSHNVEGKQIPYSVQPIGASGPLRPSTGNSGQQQQAGTGVTTPHEARQTAATIDPRVAKMSRRLSNVTWQGFEQKIVDLWGNRLKASAEDERGTRVRILIPSEGIQNMESQMVIDRLNNVVTFEGDPQMAENWEAMIDLMDRASNTESANIQLVGMGNATSGTVRRAVGLLGIQIEDSDSLAETLRFAPFSAVPDPQQDQRQKRRGQFRAIPFQPSSQPTKKLTVEPRPTRQPTTAQPTAPVPPRAGTAPLPSGQPLSPAGNFPIGELEAATSPARIVGNSTTPDSQNNGGITTTGNPLNTTGNNLTVNSVANTREKSESNSAGNILAQSSPGQSAATPARKITFSTATQQEETQDPPEGGRQILELEDDSLDGQVRIQILPEMNAIVLIGAREDIARVRRMIDRIVSGAEVSQPSTEVYTLSNSDATGVAETLTTVYQTGYEANNGPVEIIALDNNKIFVVGPEPAQTIVGDLIKKLDMAQPDPQADEKLDYEVFPLENSAALDVAQRLQGYFRSADGNANNQPLQPTPFIAAFEGPVSIIADFRSNSVIVRGNQRVLSTARGLIEKLDVGQVKTTMAVKFFPVQNASATDVAVLLQQAVNGGLPGAPQVNAPNNQNLNQNLGQGGALGSTGQLASRAATALKLLTIDGQGEPVKSGVLLDVQFSADTNSNQVIVTGPESSMELIGALIEQLDRLPNAETQIKVFTIQNGDANELLATLQTIFGTGQQQGGLGAQGGLNNQGIANLPLQTSGASPGAALINLNFAVDNRTNSILATGPAGDLQLIEDLLLRLDERDLNLRVNRIYRLSNAPAEDVSAAISQWLTDLQTVVDNDPTSQVALVSARRQVVVVPELVSNSLIISALPEFYEEVIRLIEDLDRRPPMVKIKVLIAEISLSKLSEFGVEVGIQDSLLFDRGLGLIGFPFNQAGLGNNADALALSTREILAGQAISNLAVGRTNADAGFGGVVLSAGNESINILMRALQSRGIARVLSTPDISTVDNLQGRIQVGQRVARVRGAGQGGGLNNGIQTDVEDVDVGVILEVTPRVSPDGMIIMAVDAINSSLGPVAEGVPVFASDTEVILSPNIDVVSAQTTVMARSGQSVAFAGLIQDNVTEAKRGTPILSDLPVIGPLFSFDSKEHTRSELLIVLTPYLINNESDQEASNQMAYSRMHWCADDVASVYGNIDGYDPEWASNAAVPATYYPDQDPTGQNPQYLPLEEVAPEQPGSGSRNGSAGSDSRNEPFPNELFDQPFQEPPVPNQESPVPNRAAPSEASPSPSDLPPRGSTSRLQRPGILGRFRR